MMLKLQKRLAADVMGCSPKRVVFDPSKLEDIKEAITKTDIRLLIGDGTISMLPKKGVSRGRANKIKLQKRRGLRRSAGSRKGKASARTPRKQAWVKKIRALRAFIAELREKELISPEDCKRVYMMAGGGFFRSIQHIKIFLTERDMWLKQKKVAVAEAQPSSDGKVQNRKTKTKEN